MARLNVTARNDKVTHEGAPAVPALSAEKQLRRLVMSCMLWEDAFYVDGKTIADQITEYAQHVKPEFLADLAIEARSSYNLRHVPLLLLDVLSKTGRGTDRKLVSNAVCDVVQRVDDMSELLAIHWRNGHKMVPAQMRKGLDRAFRKFNEYALAKYDRDGKVKLRDVLRVVRPKPENDEQSQLWKRVVKRELQTPDTWEVELSAGKDKKETFERLIREGKLGYFALLRNLRNMAQAGVDEKLVTDAIVARKGGAQRVLPFRYVAAARAAPQFEPAIDTALKAAISEMEELPGKTLVLVDVSGSMDDRLSARSDMRRVDAAAALASIIPGDVRQFSFSHGVVEVPPRRGMAGVDAIIHSQPHGGTYLGAAVKELNEMKCDRLIVVTDEQSHDVVPQPTAKLAYLINVAPFHNGVGYGRWVHIDGFSESVLRFITEYERSSIGVES